MKTAIQANRYAQRHNSGSVLLAVMTILAIIAILLSINADAIKRLQRELNAINIAQTNRLANVSIHAATQAK